MQKKAGPPAFFISSHVLFHRKACIFPGVKSTDQSCCVLQAELIQVEHRTGARMFGLSRTVRDDHLVPWQL